MTLIITKKWLHPSPFRKGPNIVKSLAFCGLLLCLPSALAAPSDAIKTREEKIRKEMLELSTELGATCMDCHNLKNFADPSHYRFAIAKSHIEIVALLKQKGFDGKSAPMASCTFCHQGKLYPPWLPPKSKKAEEQAAESNAPPSSPEAPHTSQNPNNPL